MKSKVDYYFDRSLTLKLVELFLLAKKFLLPAEVRIAALDKLGIVQNPITTPILSLYLFGLINRAFDRTSLHSPLRKLILDYFYLNKNSFTTKIRDEPPREGSTFDAIILLGVQRPPDQQRLLERDTELQSRTNWEECYEGESISERIFRGAYSSRLFLSGRQTRSKTEIDPAATTCTHTEEGCERSVRSKATKFPEAGRVEGHL
jgi:hypothetical protein